MVEVGLTTKDNPFDYFDQFDDWNRFDQRNGYNTIALITRVMKTSDETSEEQQRNDWEKAIDDIMQYCDFGMYTKVTRNIDAE